MRSWPSAKARLVLRALQRIGWRIKRQSGSHRTLERAGWPDYTFAFHGDVANRVDVECCIFAVDPGFTHCRTRRFGV